MAGSARKPGGVVDEEKMRRAIAEARKAAAEREKGYREQSLKIHPWVCARCGREFTRKNLHLLTVHHKDHNHDNNPADGSNWENLCVYCHENEHRRYLDHVEGGGAEAGPGRDAKLTHSPFAKLQGLVVKKDS
ncbi:conserved hypothetical protein [uncultured Desulfatiglans sp.]|uniref:Putative HNH nuclease YajD n=1 Tax=Uncultured Desulfatiglans sp. TaxID=1748965 RepID=A0A653A098_UNCDX|nr:conserved hypothetical protein [uncultured Desulfatiglans sp.]